MSGVSDDFSEHCHIPYNAPFCDRNMRVSTLRLQVVHCEKFVFCIVELQPQAQTSVKFESKYNNF